jgi:hypothetical protein
MRGDRGWTTLGAILLLTCGCTVDLDAGTKLEEPIVPCGSSDSPAVDVVIVADNSSSMSDHLASIQQQLTSALPVSLDRTGLDYRVILISRYGDVNVAVGESDHPVCLGPPLGATDCTRAATDPLVNHPPRFFQYSADVPSGQTLCLLFAAWDRPDEYATTSRAWAPLIPQGWSSLLRPEALKVFVIFTDGQASCANETVEVNDANLAVQGETGAEAFDAALLGWSPEQFGTGRARRYVWHSVTGMLAAGDVVLPDAPIVTDPCEATWTEPGTGYQALSRLTGGLRHSVCEIDTLPAWLDSVAQAAQAWCARP